MNITFRLETFEGPLDLLLHLVSVNKVQIDDIPIADILEQYMAYLDQMAALDMEITSDFLVMAAQLVLIKSRMLLPRPPEATDEDPRMSLAQRLAIYQQFKEAALLLRPLSEAGRDLLVRMPFPLPAAGPYRGKHEADVLCRALSALVGREKPRLPSLPPAFSHTMTKKRVRIEDQARRILELLAARKQMTLADALSGVTDRTVAVATFLALLDLCRTHHITLDDDNTIFEASAENDIAHEKESAFA